MIKKIAAISVLGIGSVSAISLSLAHKSDSNSQEKAPESKSLDEKYPGSDQKLPINIYGPNSLGQLYSQGFASTGEENKNFGQWSFNKLKNEQSSDLESVKQKFKNVKKDFQQAVLILQL